MRKTPANLTFEEIEINSKYKFKRTFRKPDLQLFSELTGDSNPLHMDENYIKDSNFKENVVFGMLSASLFSTLVGMYCPGKNALYLSQTLDFRNPLHLDDEIIVRGEVIEKYDKFDMIKMKTEILNDNCIFVSGEAKVKVI